VVFRPAEHIPDRSGDNFAVERHYVHPIVADRGGRNIAVVVIDEYGRSVARRDDNGRGGAGADRWYQLFHPRIQHHRRRAIGLSSTDDPDDRLVKLDRRIRFIRNRPPRNDGDDYDSCIDGDDGDDDASSNDYRHIQRNHCGRRRNSLPHGRSMRCTTSKVGITLLSDWRLVSLAVCVCLYSRCRRWWYFVYFEGLHYFNVPICINFVLTPHSEVKGCYYKNDVAYFGLNGTDKEMSTASVAQRIRSKGVL